MSDRLTEIQTRVVRAYDGDGYEDSPQDIAWLIAEVERLIEKLSRQNDAHIAQSIELARLRESIVPPRLTASMAYDQGRDDERARIKAALIHLERCHVAADESIARGLSQPGTIDRGSFAQYTKDDNTLTLTLSMAYDVGRADERARIKAALLGRIDEYTPGHLAEADVRRMVREVCGPGGD